MVFVAVDSSVDHKVTSSHCYLLIPIPRSATAKGSLSNDYICLSVCLCLSVADRAYLRLVPKLRNQSSWKFRTTLGPSKSITGCSIMTSSQIQHGWRPLIRQFLWSDYDKIWYTEWISTTVWILCGDAKSEGNSGRIRQFSNFISKLQKIKIPGEFAQKRYGRTWYNLLLRAAAYRLEL